MLTLGDSRRVERATVYRDVSWSDGSRALTSQFYVLPDEPALASGEGSSGYTFYRYRGAAGSGEGGGLLVLAARLPMPDGIADAVRTAYGLAMDAQVTVGPPPFSASAARVALAGETGPGDFVTSVTCTSDTSSGNVAVVAALTRDGASLVDLALQQGVAPVHVELDLSVDFVLDDLELTVWCDVQASAQVAGELAAAGQGGSAALTAELVARQLAGTTLRTVRPLSADEQAAVAAVSAQLLQSVVLPGLLDDDGTPRAQHSASDQRVALSLTASAPGRLPLTRSANLGLPDGTANTVSADLGEDGLRRVVRVSADGDLSARGIAAVAVALDSSGRMPDGSVLRRTADVDLRPDRPAALVAFDIATPDQRQVSAHVTVHFVDGSPPYAFDLPPTAADAIGLDVDALGVVVVDVALAAGEPGAGVQAVVDLACGATGSVITGRFVLDATRPTARWVAAVREMPQPYRYRVTWLRGADRSEGEWQVSDHSALWLVPPFAAPTTTVTVISAGSFDQLSALIVELRAGDDQPVTTLTFTAPDQTKSWTMPTGTTAYEYRTTLVRSDGSHVAGPSVPTDQPVLVVRDTLRFDLTVVPVLLGVGTRLTRALVEVEGPDPAAPHVTVVFDPPAGPARVTLRLTDPAAHDYRYRVTLCPPSLPPQVGEWLSGSSSVLVPAEAPKEPS